MGRLWWAKLCIRTIVSSYQLAGLNYLFTFTVIYFKTSMRYLVREICLVLATAVVCIMMPSPNCTDLYAAIPRYLKKMNWRLLSSYTIVL